jgi:hypothetical protein
MTNELIKHSLSSTGSFRSFVPESVSARTDNSIILRPKGLRFDSPGQRPGTRSNNDTKPQPGATLANDQLNSGIPRSRPIGPFFPTWGSYPGLQPGLSNRDPLGRNTCSNKIPDAHRSSTSKTLTGHCYIKIRPDSQQTVIATPPG